MSSDEFLYLDEVRLIGYGESDSSGKWIKFEVHDLEKFRGRKGSMMAIGVKLVQNDGTMIADDGANNKGGQLSKDAAMLCRNNDFQSFTHYRTGKPASEANARLYILEFCGISSRAELDHTQAAKNSFKQMFKDYGEFLNNGSY